MPVLNEIERSTTTTLRTRSCRSRAPQLRLASSRTTWLLLASQCSARYPVARQLPRLHQFKRGPLPRLHQFIKRRPLPRLHQFIKRRPLPCLHQFKRGPLPACLHSIVALVGHLCSTALCLTNFRDECTF